MKKLQEIQRLIKIYEEKYHRSANSVQLLAVSKGQPIEKMRLAYQAGQRLFGENYLQEALDKMSILPKDIEWHYIGKIQRNKTKKIAEHFTWVQSVADELIAKRLNEQRPNHLPPLNICIEVNINNEASKSGADKNDLLTLAKTCMALPKLQLRGLMAIPAPTNDFQTQRQIFHELFALYTSLIQQGMPLDTLSMGMTHDFEAAIAEGATIIRVGTGIFGERV